MVTFDDVVPDAIALARRCFAATPEDMATAECCSTCRLASLVVENRAVGARAVSSERVAKVVED